MVNLRRQNTYLRNCSALCIQKFCFRKTFEICIFSLVKKNLKASFPVFQCRKDLLFVHKLMRKQYTYLSCRKMFRFLPITKPLLLLMALEIVVTQKGLFTNFKAANILLLHFFCKIKMSAIT